MSISNTLFSTHAQLVEIQMSLTKGSFEFQINDFFIKKRLKFKYVYENIKANHMFSPLIIILISF